MKFFAAHAGMPTDTGFPDYGDAGSTRVFLTDLGWEVALSEVYVTTQAIRLVRCGKQQGTEIEMFWGTCPEDFVTSQDRETLPLGALTIEDGDFCEVEVVFGPYVDDGGEEEHTKPSNPEVVGATVLIEGVARRDPGDGMIIEVPFALRVEDELASRMHAVIEANHVDEETLGLLLRQQLDCRCPSWVPRLPPASECLVEGHAGEEVKNPLVVPVEQDGCLLQVAVFHGLHDLFVGAQRADFCQNSC